MSNQQVCLLCLQTIGDKGAKSPKKIRFETLFKLVTPNSKTSHPPPEFKDDEIYEFCNDCYPLLSTMEEIKKQISLLEEVIRSKVRQIKTTILHSSSSSHLRSKEKKKILQIRDMLVKVAGENAEKLVPDEGRVKVDVEEEGDDDVDIIVDGDNFFDDDLDSYPKTSAEQEDDTAFCIIPDNKSPNKHEKSRTTKRKGEDSSPPPKTSTKRNKLQPDRPETSPTRFSPRIKRQTAPLTRVKIRVASLKKITSNSESSEEDDDANSTLDSNDKDWAPNEDVDPITTSGAVHKCTECAKSFPSEWLLNRHTGRFHGLPCLSSFCTSTFRSVKERYVHMKTAHEGLASIQCRICKNKFSHQRELGTHMVIRHENGEKKLSCDKCEKKFCLEENLARHVKLHEVEGIKPVVCDLCDNRFESEERLKRHLASKTHSKPFTCSECGMRCNGRVDLERHLRSHTKEKAVKCPHCDLAVGDKDTLQRHIIRAHPDGPATHMCHICAKGFYHPVDLKKHVDRHEGKFEKKCDTCDETFSGLSSLRVHLIKVHGKDPLVCNECGATFASLGGLRLHQKGHAGERKHKCETCGARFIAKGGLNVHMRTHTGERPFPCPHCDKAFRTRTCMNKHVKVIHTPGYVAPAPHKCPHCDKGCRTPYFLRCHIRQAHTGERPFVCDNCGKGFTVRSALTNHLKMVHGVVFEKKDKLPRSKKDAVHEEDEDDDEEEEEEDSD